MMKALRSNYFYISAVMVVLFSCKKIRNQFTGPQVKSICISWKTGIKNHWYISKRGLTNYFIQHTKPKYWPYIHPIITPDGKGVLAEYSSLRHQYQIGFTWVLPESPETMHWIQKLVWILVFINRTAYLDRRTKIGWNVLLRKLI